MSGASVDLATRGRVLTVFGRRISRDTAIYVVGTCAAFPAGLITVAVFTRYIDPSQYGIMAVLLTYAGLLTTVYNLGSLQGTFRWTFGQGDGEDIDIDDGGAPVGKKRAALSTGTLLTAGVCLVATVIQWPFSSQLSDLLTGSPNHVSEVQWALVSAAFGALWRLMSNIMRMERRPKAFAIISGQRPLFVVLISIPLVANGGGVNGAIAGTALGTIVACALALLVTRRSYEFAFERSSAVGIMKTGSRYIPIVIGLWVAHNADIFFLAHYTDTEQVGLYRIASRIASFISYFVSAFLLAWAPLERTSLFAGTYIQRGADYVRSLMMSYFIITSLWIVLVFGVGSDVLVRIAAPSYAEAAPLIPLIGLGYVMYGLFIVMMRGAKIANRMFWYRGLAISSGFLYGAFAIVLIPALGSYGAALSIFLSMGVVNAIGFWRIHRGGEPVPFEWGKLFVAFVVALVLWALATQVAHDAPDELGTLVDLLAIVLFPVILVALHIIPRAHAWPLVRIATAAMQVGGGAKDLMAKVPELSPRRRDALESVTRHKMSVRATATRDDLDLDHVHERVVRALRHVGSIGEPTEHDAAIGRWVLGEEAPADRDAIARNLWQDGVDPLEMHDVETALTRLRAVPQRAWRRLDQDDATIAFAGPLPENGGADSLPRPMSTSPSIPSDHVMVGGTGRSGTTVLGRLIGSHSRYTCLPFEARFPTHLPRLADGRIEMEEFSRLMRENWFKRFRRVLPEDQMEGAMAVFEQTWEEDHAAASRRLIHSLMDPVAAANATSGWVEMTPVNMMWTVALTELVPDVRFVHAVRDGRDVAASVAKTWGGMDEAGALEWWSRRLLDTNRPGGFVGPGVVHIVRLEALVRDDREASYAALLDFLDLEDEPAMRTYFTETLNADTANIGRWRRTLDEAQQEATTKRYRELLDALADEGVECAPALIAAVDDV